MSPASLLAGYDLRLLKDAEGRRVLTRLDPRLFALLYLPHHLRDDEGNISLSEMHLTWCAEALDWVRPVRQPRDARAAHVAPRDSGKSTWWFTILPLWAAAHGHKKFIAAFADSATQAEIHLATFRRELVTNELLQYDYPDLCQASTDNRSMLTTSGGFTFAARGIDASSLGLKVGQTRPDLILLDDIEPQESSYSAHQAKQRLSALQDAVLPMNERAHVVLVGTVTMLDSIVHQLVKTVTAPEDQHPPWCHEERFRVHYFAPIITGEDGDKRSLWPEKWALDYLLSIQHTRSYAKNFANQPVSDDGTWWRTEDIRYHHLSSYDRVVMVVDGAVTTKAASDFTGVAVVGLDVRGKRFFVREALALKLAGEELRSRIIDVALAQGVDYILVEANQGGDLWYTVLHDMPVKISTFSQSEPKRVRIRRLLAAYQRASGHVLHERPLPELEAQQRAYPNVLHEDTLDAAAACVEHLTHMLLRALGHGVSRAEAKQLQMI